MSVLVRHDVRARTVFDPRDYGTLPDGSTDNATAINAAIADAQNAPGGVVSLCAGEWRYGSALAITNRVAIIGAGKRYTYLRPTGSYTGPAITVTECWRNDDEESSDPIGYGPTVYAATASVTSGVSKGGVTLIGFSISGDRDDGYAREGIRFVGRNDSVLMRDVGVEWLAGRAICIGLDSHHSYGLMRESLFDHVTIRGCADDTVPAVYIGTGSLTQDATNHVRWEHCELIFNWGVHLLIELPESHTDPQATRRIHFQDLMVHGLYEHVEEPPAADLIQVVGRCHNIRFDGFRMNGGVIADDVMYAGFRFTGNSTGAPQAIVLDGDIRNMNGDGVVIEDMASGSITLSGQANSIDGDILRVDTDAITDRVYYDDSNMNGTRTVDIAADQTGKVIGWLDSILRADGANLISTATTDVPLRIKGTTSQSSALIEVRDVDGNVMLSMAANGAVTTLAGKNLLLGGGSAGSGTGVLAMANATANPSTDPTGGGVLYVDGGALKYRGSSGTVTTLGNA